MPHTPRLPSIWRKPATSSRPKSNGASRYIEKPPLPYWLVAGAYKIFGQNTFATHLPNALAMLGLTWLAWLWARKAWGDRAGLYAGLAVLASVGTFLFTRFIIPEAELSFFLLAALYCLITGLEFDRPARFYWITTSASRLQPHPGTQHRSRVFFIGRPPFPICCLPANGVAGVCSSPLPGRCCF